jgi:carboxylesterase
MTQHNHLDPSPFFLPGGPVGVLLLHGFTGSPPEMRLLADDLHERGYTVAGPLLPGHGTRVEDMNGYRWRDWVAHAEGALVDLEARCEKVFMGGLSLGSLISIYLGAQHPELAGVMAYSPAVLVANRAVWLVPFLKYFLPVLSAGPTPSDLTDPEAEARLWCYEETPLPATHETMRMAVRAMGQLPHLRVPLLVVYSTGDRTIHADSGRYTYEIAGSPDKELLVLNHSGHALTVDSEWRAVAERTAGFIARHGG